MWLVGLRSVKTDPIEKRYPLMYFHIVGDYVVKRVNSLGTAFVFLLRAFALIFRRKQMAEIRKQVYHIGATSSGIVLIVGAFTGMVLGLQLYYTLVKFGSVGMVGAAISLTIIRELGPVLAAIMITARAGSAMAAEIGIQRITEQIDALYTMRVDPMAYLVSPRIAAAIVSFPILTAFFDLIGILGGWVTAVVLLNVDSGAYLYRVQSSVELADIAAGFAKSIVFAVLVSVVCCYQGYHTHLRAESRGTTSVSVSTTSAVVLSCVLILVSDYVVTSFLM